MPESLGSAVLKLTGDASQLERDMATARTNVTSSLQETGQRLATLGTKMTAAVTLPLLGLAGVAANAASDLNESINAVNVVFGEAADVVKAYGETSAESVGLAQSAFLELGSKTGALLQNLGYDQSAAADETIRLTERASDMASVFNTDVSTAMAAIQSGLKGEFDPLEQFGVKINAAAINAKALEMGLADSTGALDDNAKAQAAMALIYEQTNMIAGDFANTSDGVANSSRIAKAELMDAAAQIGKLLLPVAAMLISHVRDLVAWFTSLSPRTMQIILLIAGLAAAIGPLVTVIGGVITAVGAVVSALSGVMLPILLAVIAVVGLLYLAWTQNWGGIQQKTTAALAHIRTLITTALAQISAWWTAHGDEVTARVAAMWASLQAAFQVAFEALLALVSTTLTAISAWWTAHGDEVTAMVTAFWGMISAAYNAAITWLSGAVSGILSSMSAWWTAHGDTVQAIAQGLWDGIQAIMSTAIEALTHIFDAFRSAFEGDWRGFGEELRKAWDAVWTLIQDALGNAVEAIKNVPWKSMGSNIINGLRQGVIDAAQKLVQAVVAAVKAAYEAAKGFLGVQSPSKLFAEMGHNVSLGLAGGVRGSMHLAAGAGLDLGKAVAQGAAGGAQVINQSQQHIYNLYPRNDGQRDSVRDYVRMLQALQERA